MLLRWLLAVLILPGNVLVVIPCGLLFAFRAGPWRHDWAAWDSLRGASALALALAGLSLALWTMGLFARHGEGTAAPWDPPQKFVARGPYLRVRNPMIISVFIMLLAESLFTGSRPVAVWFLAFVTVNLFYIPLSEERGLEARFGEEYRRYQRAVPRWLPKFRP